MKPVLVTGASGKLGSYLVAELVTRKIPVRAFLDSFVLLDFCSAHLWQGASSAE